MFNQEIPILKKSLDLYKLFYSFKNYVPRPDRYLLWQKCEDVIMKIVEETLTASQINSSKRVEILEKISINLNLIRILFRLTHEIKILDNKKYIKLAELTDEIGKMLGGWLKATKNQAQIKHP